MTGGTAASGVLNLEWLLQEATGPHSFYTGEYTRLDNEHWLATVEQLDIGPGLRIILTEAEIRRPLVIEPGQGEPTPWLTTVVTTSGRVAVTLADDRRLELAPDHAVLYREVERRYRYDMPAKQTLRLAGYMLREDRIERLFDGNPPPVLRPLLDPAPPTNQFLTLAASRRMRSLAEALFARGLNGPLRTLYMEGTVLQLLALTLAALGEAPAKTRPALSERERRAVRQAHERLLADMRSPPALGALAQAVGLTEKRLSAGFRALFGASVYETLRNARLEHARLVLERETVPIKDVAFRVGYNHVTNFINAFTARFGAPPRRYLQERRAAKESDDAAVPRRR